MRPDTLLKQQQDPQIAWGTPTRGDRTFVEIIGESLTVILKGGVVRVVLQLEGVSRVVTDFAQSVEIRAWSRGRAPPARGKRPAGENGNGTSGAG